MSFRLTDNSTRQRMLPPSRFLDLERRGEVCERRFRTQIYRDVENIYASVQNESKEKF